MRKADFYFHCFMTSMLVLGLFWVLAIHARAFAQQAVDIPCPNDEKCQVLVLTETEIKVLTGDNGILATAAQARNLDLGQFVAYFRQKIALAPAGKNAPKAPAEPEKKPEEPKK